jgi:hypothetical protein
MAAGPFLNVCSELEVDGRTNGSAPAGNSLETLAIYLTVEV